MKKRTKEYEGEVEFDRTSDAGDPSFDFEYSIGYETAPTMDELLKQHIGKRIKMKIIIEELEEETEED